MTTSRKLSSFAAAVLVACLTLSACGDEDDPAEAESTSRGGTHDIALTEHTFHERLTTAQADAGSAHVEMTMGVRGQAITASGDIEAGKTAADSSLAMVMDIGSMGSLDMRLVDEVIYMNFGTMTQNKFVKLDLTDASNPIAKQYGQIVEQMDPSRQMELLGEAVKSFEKHGEPEQIDGVEAQPYVVVLDAAKLPGLEGLTGSQAAQVPDEITYTVFIGPDDLLRRMTFDAAGVDMTMDYSKWGEPVDIEAPNPSEVSDHDLSELLSGALNS